MIKPALLLTHPQSKRRRLPTLRRTVYKLRSLKRSRVVIAYGDAPTVCDRMAFVQMLDDVNQFLRCSFAPVLHETKIKSRFEKLIRGLTNLGKEFPSAVARKRGIRPERLKQICRHCRELYKLTKKRPEISFDCDELFERVFILCNLCLFAGSRADAKRYEKITRCDV
jgi:hypothetical protein